MSRQNPIRVTVPFENAVSQALQAPCISEADLGRWVERRRKEAEAEQAAERTSERPAWMGAVFVNFRARADDRLPSLSDALATREPNGARSWRSGAGR